MFAKIAAAKPQLESLYEEKKPQAMEVDIFLVCIAFLIQQIWAETHDIKKRENRNKPCALIWC
jgi:hypothetical protein